MRCDDPDAAAVDEPSIALYCPPCAAGEFGYRPEAAANYVCAWEALPLSMEPARAFSVTMVRPRVVPSSVVTGRASRRAALHYQVWGCVDPCATPCMCCTVGSLLVLQLSTFST